MQRTPHRCHAYAAIGESNSSSRSGVGVPKLATTSPARPSNALWGMTQLMARRVKARYAPAVNLHLSDGAEAEQDIPHAHMHVVPRHSDDAVVIELPGARAPGKSPIASRTRLPRTNHR